MSEWIDAKDDEEDSLFVISERVLRRTARHGGRDGEIVIRVWNDLLRNEYDWDIVIRDDNGIGCIEWGREKTLEKAKTKSTQEARKVFEDALIALADDTPTKGDDE